MAVILTVNVGRKTRRYAVEPEDEDLFADFKLPMATDVAAFLRGENTPEAENGGILYLRIGWAGVIARWVRSGNNLDEMVCNISGIDVVKVSRGIVKEYGGYQR